MPTNNMDSERLLADSHDGIQEYDNPLPRWWVWIFWATILFAVLYVLDFTGTLRGPGRIKDYEAEMAAAAAKYPKPSSAVSPEMLAAAAKDPTVIAAGKQIFTTTCSPCHRADGGGLIGPNLTDEYWLHGGTLPEIYKTITDGVLEKGMPQWGKVFNPDQIKSLAVYVRSLQGTNPPNPKAPQGSKVTP